MTTNLLPRSTFYTLVLILFIYCGSSHAQEKTIEIVTEVDWSESNAFEDNKGSLATQISALVLERMGYKVNISFAPWARALRMTEDGKVDGLSGVYYTEQRANSLIFTDHLTTTEIVLFKRKDSDITYNGDLKELASYNIGVVRNYTYGALFDNASYINKVVAIKPSNNIRMLIGKRVDLIVGSNKAINFLLSQKYPEHLDDIIPLSPIIKKQEVYFAFSKKLHDQQHLVKRFNQVLSELRNDGSIEKLENQFALAQLSSLKHAYYSSNDGY